MKVRTIGRVLRNPYTNRGQKRKPLRIVQRGGWFARLSDLGKASYRKKHPGTKL